MDPDFSIRPACNEDIPHLIPIEQTLFSSDRLSVRQMRYHIRNERAVFLTGTERGMPVGYALFLKREGARARLYSLAVDRGYQGKGYGKALLERYLPDHIHHDRT